jgi:hypothetical protein
MYQISRESEFENHIRLEFLFPIVEENPDLKLFNFKKAVDILIAKNGNNPKLFFIEIKYHKKSNGRLGFGQGKGAGFQPEVLKDQTDYFENNMRWILGHEDSEDYWIMDNKTLRQYLNANVVGEKYNGIRTKLFKEFPSMNKAQLFSELNQWLNQ